MQKLERKRESSFLFVGGRKYLFVWSIFVVATIALFLKYGNLTEWGVIVVALAGFYFGANVTQKKFQMDDEGK